MLNYLAVFGAALGIVAAYGMTFAAFRRRDPFAVTVNAGATYALVMTLFALLIPDMPPSVALVVVGGYTLHAVMCGLSVYTPRVKAGSRGRDTRR